MSTLRPALALTIFVAVMAGVAWACGPDFPQQLLDDRGTTLRATPVNSFAFDMSHLLKASDKLVASESLVDAGAVASANAASIDAGLSAVQLQTVARIQALDAAHGGDEAYAMGEGLPEAVRLYVAGALDFRHYMAACSPSAVAIAAGDEQLPPLAVAGCVSDEHPELQHAVDRFSAVLALPAEQSRVRVLAAAFMLGRIHWLQLMGCVDCKPGDRVGTVEADFARVRSLALGGAPDPLGLAVASYGEQARVHLRGDSAVTDGSAEGNVCRWQGLLTGAQCAATIAPTEYAKAMRLYAEQAARHSARGVQSLRMLAGYASAHPALLDGLLADPLAQRVLVSYALAYSNDAPADPDGASGNVIGKDRLAALTDAIARQGAAPVEGVDQMAALAYRSGRYDLAARLVGTSSTPRASWVKAKLALHEGNLPAAAAAYAQALKTFPLDGQASDGAGAGLAPDNRARLQGEQAVLSLARGEYIQALDQLWGQAASYWGDAAYLAERVLTVDELQHFVDSRVPTASGAPVAMKTDDDTPSYAWYGNQLSRNDALRELLARRLMREGRYEAALPYFRAPQPRKVRATTASVAAGDDEKVDPQRHREWARDYAQALATSRHAWTDIGKAEAMYAAAVIAREHGMEILGYEEAPDYFAVDGVYPGGLGQDQAKVGVYLTQVEHDRFIASAAKPDHRLHYRYIATDTAAHAAELLPTRSQAYAAVLCHATGWMMQGPSDYADNHAGGNGAPPTAPSAREQRVTQLYRRYLTHGAHVAWARDFGRSCPTPRFDGARTLLRQQRIARARHLLRHYLPYEIAALLLLVLAAWVLHRRRRATR